jgi:hypothetical protein
MVIGVAIGTLLVFYRICYLGFVAGLAGYIEVFINQRKSRFRMVKIGLPFYGMKGFAGMTFIAICTEFAVVGVGVAIGAALKSDPGKLLEFFPLCGGDLVALYAFNGFMFSR